MDKTIIIVDDHTLFARSLEGLIQSLGGFEVIKLLKNGQELQDYYKTNRRKPEIVLLDIRMPGMDGVQIMAWLKENYPDQKTLALTMEENEEFIIKMVRLGCRGYLVKDIEPDEFLFALKSVCKSGYYYSEEVSHALEKASEKRTYKNLTVREMEFLHHACSEMTYKEVARKMSLSPKTIDGYRESLFNKLEVKSRVGLVLFSVKNDLFRI